MPRLDSALKQDKYRPIAVSFEGTGLLASLRIMDDDDLLGGQYGFGQDFLVMTLPSSGGVSKESELMNDLTKVVFLSYAGSIDPFRALEQQEGFVTISYNPLAIADVTGAAFDQNYPVAVRQYDRTFLADESVLLSQETDVDELNARLSPPDRPRQRMRVKLKSIGQLSPRIAIDPERD